MTKVYNLSVQEFADLFQTTPEEIPSECRRLIEKHDFHYRVLEGNERDEIILQILKTLELDLDVSGQHRKDKWESGWTQNLDEFIASGYSLDALIPKYHFKNQTARFQGNYIRPVDPGFEYNFLKILRVWILHHYFNNITYVHEFGCGPGHNLAALAEVFPEKKYYGIDWAKSSQKIIQSLAQVYNLPVKGFWFDMFNPDMLYDLPENSGVCTFCAMEQLGENFEPFLQFLLEKKPEICVNVEITYELYDPDKLFDYLAIRYLNKRGYLKGFLSRLRDLEKQNKVKILQTRRLLGSPHHEGHTILAWKVL